MNKQATLAQVQELKLLARKVRDHYEATDKLVTMARKFNHEAIAEAVLCGQALTKAKTLCGHGKFQHWLKEHCKDVSERTCRRYMTLSKRTHVTDLNTAGSMRQAYIMTGIITEQEMASEPQPVNPITTRPVTTSPASNARTSSVTLPKGSKRLASLKVEAIDHVEVITGLVGDLLTQLKALPRKQTKQVRDVMKPLKRWV